MGCPTLVLWFMNYDSSSIATVNDSDNYFGCIMNNVDERLKYVQIERTEVTNKFMNAESPSYNVSILKYLKA